METFRDQPPAADERIAQDQRVIVPDKAVAQGGQVDEESRRDDHEERAGAREILQAGDDANYRAGHQVRVGGDLRNHRRASERG